jgi:hypothetical protein
MFPDARFLHVVQHPATYVATIEATLRAARAAHAGTLPLWLQRLACFPTPVSGDEQLGGCEPDPLRAWSALHGNIAASLESVPAGQQLRVQAEAVLATAPLCRRTIARWLGLRADRAALAPMLHPERSPYAGFGPPNARFGNDPSFLQRPELGALARKCPRRQGRALRHGQPRDEAVSQRAARFGYL